MSKPQHIAIIMDGNGRWARKRGLLRAKGHEQGGKTVQTIVDKCLEHGIPWLTLYAFSAENWGRPKPEVNYLMDMLCQFLSDNIGTMQEKGVRLHAIGELHMLPLKCQEMLNRCLEQTAHNTALHLTLALSYGARQEICHAARCLAEQVQRGEISPADITPERLSTQLYTTGMPDPDLLIRTSGEMRLSNFLLWQCSYTELHITPVLWPDFGAADFEAALKDYEQRHRRFGKH